MATFKAYLWAIVLGLLVAGGVFLYAKGRLDANHAAQLAALNTTIDSLKADNKKLEDIQKADQLQAMQDAEDKERLNALIDSQYAELAKPDDPCFDAGDVDRVRSLFAPATAAASGHTR